MPFHPPHHSPHPPLQIESSLNMQQLKPTIDKIKAQYGDDKEAISRETSALYAKAGVDPLAGEQAGGKGCWTGQEGADGGWLQVDGCRRLKAAAGCCWLACDSQPTANACWPPPAPPAPSRSNRRLPALAGHHPHLHRTVPLPLRLLKQGGGRQRRWACVGRGGCGASAGRGVVLQAAGTLWGWVYFVVTPIQSQRRAVEHPALQKHQPSAARCRPLPPCPPACSLLLDPLPLRPSHLGGPEGGGRHRLAAPPGGRRAAHRLGPCLPLPRAAHRPGGHAGAALGSMREKERPLQLRVAAVVPAVVGALEGSQTG